MRVVVTGGGTGGHIYPALAVVEAFHRIDAGIEAAYVGGALGMEALIVPATGIRFVGVTTKKLRRLASPATVGVLIALARGYGEASRFFRSFRPEVVISTGGYVAAATTIAAARLSIPTVILAPDAIPGRTNLLVSRWVKRVCIMFEESRSAFPVGKVALTGLPIRAGIVSSEPQAAARTTFGLDPALFTVLATGGSQGAQRLNEIVGAAVGYLPDRVQALHQVGMRNADMDQVTQAIVERRDGTNRYVSVPYFDEKQIALAYRAADLTVCRCGVGSLAEAAANGLPMLMVPLPTAYADHQTHNARAMERGGAGIVLPQSDLTAETLAEIIGGLSSNAGRLAVMASASRALGRPDAADRVAGIALEIL